MSEPQFILQTLLNGAISASIWVAIAHLLSRFVHESAGRSMLTGLLFVAAGAYVWFAIDAGASSFWIGIETVQVVGFGALALLGWLRSPSWLAAGWALHPFWDAALHYLGPGQSFAPAVYAISCISFDWIVAAYVVIAYRAAALRPETATP